MKISKIIAGVSAVFMLSGVCVSAAGENSVYTVAQADSACVYSMEDIELIDADVYIIPAAVDYLRDAAVSVLCKKFGAASEERNSLTEAVKSKSAEEISRIMGNITFSDMADFAVAKTSAVKQVQQLAEEVRKIHPDAELHILNACTLGSGSSNVLVAEVLNIMNSEIKAVAEKYNAEITDVSSVKLSYGYVSGMTGDEAAAAFEKSFTSVQNGVDEKINSDAVLPETPVYLYGDLNGDGKIATDDLVCMIRLNLGDSSFTSAYTDEELNVMKKCGNVFKDTELCGLSDIMLLKKCIIEDISEDELGKIHF